MQQVECTFDTAPVWQMKERVRYGFGITAFENVLRWQYQAFHLQQVLATRARVRVNRAGDDVRSTLGT